GYISLEVSPELANDTAGTLTEARRLFKTLSRPNVMIKVPATPAGIPAIEVLISEGINVNVTLIFSIEQYRAVALAYLAGLEKFAQKKGDLSKVSSVASFFVSRVDTALDPILAGQGHTELQARSPLQRQSCLRAFHRIIFWRTLAETTRTGRVSAASVVGNTGTKNPLYSTRLYVDSLIGANTVNTVPPETVDRFSGSWQVEDTSSADSRKPRQISNNFHGARSGPEKLSPINCWMTPFRLFPAL
ncbi:MAG: hypothetical protein IPO77_21870, partial [Acidobacteria bacterium]|nr:hypothetical protein [Acidobacteriota bacterium]